MFFAAHDGAGGTAIADHLWFYIGLKARGGLGHMINMARERFRGGVILGFQAGDMHSHASGHHIIKIGLGSKICRH